MFLMNSPFLAGKVLYVGADGTLTDKDPLYFESVPQLNEFLETKFPNVRVVWKRTEDLKADPERWKAV
jgi:hypothetical protein